MRSGRVREGIRGGLREEEGNGEIFHFLLAIGAFAEMMSPSSLEKSMRGDERSVFERWKDARGRRGRRKRRMGMC